MIYVRDKGRMCNNILQYGHLYAWGRENGRETISMRFAYKYPYFRISRTGKHNIFRYLLSKYGAKAGLFPVVSFDEEGMDTTQNEARMLAARNVVVQGWYARFYPEFLKYFDEIRDLFSFRSSIEKRTAGFIADRTAPGSVRLGLHVRRGDYARWYGGRYFYSDQVYIGIIEKFHDFAGKDVTVFICTNDSSLDLCSYRKKFDETGVKVVLADGNEAEDLCLLSECDYLIGPPSTYSLVAAMYRDLPLCWVKDPDLPLTEESFGYFRQLFREII